MNFHSHHIGDHLTASAHLTWLEDCALRRLIDLYLKNERPIVLDTAQAARLVRATTPEERAAVETVLSEFFVPDERGWTRASCDTEIIKARDAQHRARENGKKGGRPKSAPTANPVETQPVTDGFDVGIHPVRFENPDENDSQAPITQYPLPSTHSSVPIGTALAERVESYAASRTGAEAAATSLLEQVAVMERKDGDALRDEDEKLLWAAGRLIFGEAGVNKDAAGRFIGKLIKDCNNDRVLVFDAMRAACLERPLDPRGWMTATCQRMRGERAPATTNKQLALEERNRAVALAWAANKATNDPEMNPPATADKEPA